MIANLARPRQAICSMIVLLGIAPYGEVQTVPYERSLPQSKATVEQTVEELQYSTAGRLPILDGFADAGDRPLDRFERPYYQCKVQVSSTPSGGSRVRVTATITAWYVDPVVSKSGYQVLPSNGRLETDFLDRLQEALGKVAVASSPPRSSPVVEPKATDAPRSTIPAPPPEETVPAEPSSSAKPAAAGSSPFQIATAPTERPATRQAAPDLASDELAQEAKNLEEIRRTQAHPNNLVAVKQSGTPVFASASEGAKVLFQASGQDEFELLDMNASWVHVRISGISRGWIPRSRVEMPEGLESAPETKPSAAAPTPSAPAAESVFQVENEQIASFPGNWEPLRGKTVKIISVQEAKGKANETDSQAKLAYAKSVFDREYLELTRASSLAAGVVVVFDAEDGGMMAATMPVLEQWKSGTLSDQALWHRCYFDPPELLGSSSTVQ
ncbi:MAG TPA: hypothetical protein VEK33_17760 [Terriglobales bacterium]|nr:hypothetical protein [Terriglobales bacterium]